MVLIDEPCHMPAHMCVRCDLPELLWRPVFPFSFARHDLCRVICFEVCEMPVPVASKAQPGLRATAGRPEAHRQQLRAVQPAQLPGDSVQQINSMTGLPPGAAVVPTHIDWSEPLPFARPQACT